MLASVRSGEVVGPERVSVATAVVSPAEADSVPLPVSSRFARSPHAENIPASRRLAAKLSKVLEWQCMATLLSRY
jgi:hypothetical protein